jgi:hypothetical protein
MPQRPPTYAEFKKWLNANRGKEEEAMADPLFVSDMSEAVWKISKESACPKVGAKSFEGRFTLVDVPEDRKIAVSGQVVKIVASTYLLRETSYGECSIYASTPTDARTYFVRFATAYAIHKGEVPPADGKLRKRPGSVPRPVAEEVPPPQPRWDNAVWNNAVWEFPPEVGIPEEAIPEWRPQAGR